MPAVLRACLPFEFPAPAQRGRGGAPLEKGVCLFAREPGEGVDNVIYELRFRFFTFAAPTLTLPTGGGDISVALSLYRTLKTSFSAILNKRSRHLDPPDFARGIRIVNTPLPRLFPTRFSS